MNAVEPAGSPFDALRRTDADGEYWTGRDLMPVMEYAQWRDFATVIEKAKVSLALVQGQDAADHAFSQLTEVVQVRNLGQQNRLNYRLTRFGAYLTAMAGDDTKTAVANARVYFAVKTREAEVAPTVPQYAIPQTYAAALRLAATQAPDAQRAAGHDLVRHPGREGRYPPAADEAPDRCLKRAAPAGSLPAGAR